MSINPLESGIAKDLDNSKINYTANKKASRALMWAIVAAVLLVMGLFVKQITILFILIVSGISMYYANNAKKEGSTNLPKIKLAKIVSTIVVVVALLIFVLNILHLASALNK